MCYQNISLKRSSFSWKLEPLETSTLSAWLLLYLLLLLLLCLLFIINIFTFIFIIKIFVPHFCCCIHVCCTKNFYYFLIYNSKVRCTFVGIYLLNLLIYYLFIYLILYKNCVCLKRLFNNFLITFNLNFYTTTTRQQRLLLIQRNALFLCYLVIINYLINCSCD